MSAVLSATASTRAPQKPRTSTWGTAGGRKRARGASSADGRALMEDSCFQMGFGGERLLHRAGRQAADVVALQEQEEDQAGDHHDGDARLYGAPVDGAEVA